MEAGNLTCVIYAVYSITVHTIIMLCSIKIVDVLPSFPLSFLLVRGPQWPSFSRSSISVALRNHMYSACPYVYGSARW